jgi:tRNA-2-methylthio-N6-dimethylallyladenosine synthase/ribosomal protein S12 methylthiotransferase
MIGERIEVLIDRAAGRDAEDGYVARHRGQAPDIDSVTFVTGEGLHPGQLVEVKVKDFQAYDLVAEVPKKKARALAVLNG